MDLTRIGAMFQGLGAAANDYYKLEKQRQEMEYYDEIKRGQIEANKAMIAERMQQVKVSERKEASYADTMNRAELQKEKDLKVNNAYANITSNFIRGTAGKVDLMTPKGLQYYGMEYLQNTTELDPETKLALARKLASPGIAKSDRPPTPTDHSYQQGLTAAKAGDDFQKATNEFYRSINAAQTAKIATVKDPKNRMGVTMKSYIDPKTGVINQQAYNARPAKPGVFVNPMTDQFVGEPAAYEQWNTTPAGQAFNKAIAQATSQLALAARKADRSGNKDVKGSYQKMMGDYSKLRNKTLTDVQGKPQYTLGSPDQMAGGMPFDPRAYQGAPSQEAPDNSPDQPDLMTQTAIPGQTVGGASGGEVDYESKAQSEFTPVNYEAFRMLIKGDETHEPVPADRAYLILSSK